ncbi:MAG: D-alanyl-D-alanine carboxypeptidase (penicillin-binding protein 5/6) [Akkermansiaceae bacterium]|jgi:D-alanyl-D-alanine carboxypeptidase (penicillin-binding protein 5/6)
MKLREIFTASLAALLAACSAGQAPPAPTPTAQPVIVRPTIVRPSLPSVNTPSIQAQSAIVIDTITGRILYQKNARTQRAVASTQKLLTALCVVKAGPLADPVTIQASDTAVEPSKVYVRTGENYTRRELVKALLIKSGNDVAKSLARDVSGTEAAFINLMNNTARSIGMTQSHFKNPHGLTEEGQFSTALDIAILAREVTKIPFYRQCMRTKSYVFYYSDGRTKTLTNTNKILSRLPYCTGMKTGTTRASGRCLVSSGVLNGKAVIAVALGSTSAEIWNDSEKLLRWALE